MHGCRSRERRAPQANPDQTGQYPNDDGTGPPPVTSSPEERTSNPGAKLVRPLLRLQSRESPFRSHDCLLALPVGQCLPCERESRRHINRQDRMAIASSGLRLRGAIQSGLSCVLLRRAPVPVPHRSPFATVPQKWNQQEKEEVTGTACSNPTYCSLQEYQLHKYTPNNTEGHSTNTLHRRLCKPRTENKAASAFRPEKQCDKQGLQVFRLSSPVHWEQNDLPPARQGPEYLLIEHLLHASHCLRTDLGLPQLPPPRESTRLRTATWFS